MIPWCSHVHLCISSLPLPLFLPFLPPSLVIPSAIFSAHDEGIYPYESGKLRPRPQGWTLLMALGMSSLDLRGQ